MYARFGWALVFLAAVATSSVLLPAAPADATGTFYMTGTYEMHNGFATRRRVRGFQPTVVTADPSGMGAITINPGVFSMTGTPVAGKELAVRVCGDPSLTPFQALGCMLNFGPQGFQAFPGFPVFAQVASTFTEVNAGTVMSGANTIPTGMLSAAGGPGSFAFCPLVGNVNNGTGVPNCAGLGLGSPTGIQGFVQYSGGNGYGGTMALLRNATVTVSQRRNVGPTQFQHDQDSRTGPWPIGVPFSHTQTTAPAPGPLTRLPFTTTLGGNTVNPANPTTPGATGTQQAGLGALFGSIQTKGPTVAQGTTVISSTTTGFPWTTGMVRGAEDSCAAAVPPTCPSPTNPNPFVQFTLTGSDARGTDGQGNLSLVSGGVFQNRDNLTTVNWGSLDLTLALPEPGTAVGLASGIMLMLGLARRRS